MLCELNTQAGGTITEEGFIPHLRYEGMDCPVKLYVDASSVRNLLELQEPMRRKGKLVYALPGGGEIAV